MCDKVDLLTSLTLNDITNDPKFISEVEQVREAYSTKCIANDHLFLNNFEKVTRLLDYLKENIENVHKGITPVSKHLRLGKVVKQALHNLAKAINNFPIHDVINTLEGFCVDSDDYALEFKSEDFVPEVYGALMQFILNFDSTFDQIELEYAIVNKHDKLLEGCQSGGVVIVTKDQFYTYDVGVLADKWTRVQKAVTSENLVSAQEIRDFREKLGMTLVAFGKLIGISSSAVNQWESGHSAPSGGANKALLLLMSIMIDD